VPKAESEVYRPAEACRIAEVAPYVLRYWETEFPALSEGRDKGPAKQGHERQQGALVVLLIYLLSLGPVQRCTGKVISYTTTPTANGFLGQRVVSYPRWVGVVYAPAFWLRQSGPWDLYDSYLEWWVIPESKK